MADIQILDKAYHVIISSLVDTGQAPHYSKLATALGCPIEEGRQIVHELAGATPASIRLNPDTDWIATVRPFSLIPTPFRISVDGEQKWFGV
jgi:hypothetical protein